MPEYRQKSSCIYLGLLSRVLLKTERRRVEVTTSGVPLGVDIEVQSRRVSCRLVIEGRRKCRERVRGCGHDGCTASTLI